MRKNITQLAVLQALQGFCLGQSDLGEYVSGRAGSTLPYPALPCPTLTYPTLPYPALPYPTLPYPQLRLSLSGLRVLVMVMVMVMD